MKHEVITKNKKIIQLPLEILSFLKMKSRCEFQGALLKLLVIHVKYEENSVQILIQIVDCLMTEAVII